MTDGAHYRYERIILNPDTVDAQVYEDDEWKTIDGQVIGTVIARKQED